MEYRIEAIRDRIRPADDLDRDDALATIRALARPRLTGSAGAREVEEELRRRLVALGYELRELPFSFSSIPGRFGVPAAGAILALGTAAAATQLLLGRGGGATLTLAATLGGVALLAAAARPATDRLPWGRIETRNWLAHRPGARPRFLVVAHRDSKSQRVSTFLRTASGAVALLGTLSLLALAAAATVDPAWRWTPLTLAAATLALLGGGTLALSYAANDSPGALDNASGLAALLGVARRERDHDDVAFLLTDAEELGLVGARAAARSLPGPLAVLNLDGLDDEGSVLIVERFGWPRRGLAPHIAAALLSAADALGLPIRRRDLPLGILVDHLPFVSAGHAAVTVMRGTLRSLRRVHRPEDRPERLSGRGAAEAAALVAGALALLRGRPGNL
jgi:hypothetical protein